MSGDSSPPDTYRVLRSQTYLLETAYSLPSQRRLESLTRPELEDYIRRFVTFKSATDRRVQAGADLAPKPLTQPEAHQLAADIVTISGFYSLPLDFFLGIGAMENNYMNVKGDLAHAVWKGRAAPGDVVLKRRRGRVLVLNQASGMWQITRETLLYAHKLYLKDTRDYSRLPSRLQPPRALNPMIRARRSSRRIPVFCSAICWISSTETSPAPSGRTTVVPGIPIRAMKRESAWSPTTPGASWNMLLSSMAAQPSE